VDALRPASEREAVIGALLYELEMDPNDADDQREAGDIADAVLRALRLFHTQ
jgi:hypothetical protein